MLFPLIQHTPSNGNLRKRTMELSKHFKDYASYDNLAALMEFMSLACDPTWAKCNRQPKFSEALYYIRIELASISSDLDRNNWEIDQLFETMLSEDNRIKLMAEYQKSNIGFDHIAFPEFDTEDPRNEKLNMVLKYFYTISIVSTFDNNNLYRFDNVAALLDQALAALAMNTWHPIKAYAHFKQSNKDGFEFLEDLIAWDTESKAYLMISNSTYNQDHPANVLKAK